MNGRLAGWLVLVSILIASNWAARFTSSRWPLLSLPRFGITVFPLFLALAWLGGRPRTHTAILGLSALLLGVFVTQWALWDWVA